MPPVFIFVGHSNAGKTTFVERLVAEFARRGQVVAAMSMLVTTDALQLVADADDRREPLELTRRFKRVESS
jgi:molybdopterin-guanine dinucleotide biosynthesis protein B